MTALNKHNADLLVVAAKEGNSVLVGDLLATVDARDNDSVALRWAAANGHVECVRLLIPVSDPHACHSAALRFSAMAGATECVRALLPLCEVEEDKIKAVSGAVLHGRFDCVDVLYGSCDPNLVLTTLLAHKYASYYRREIARFQELIPQKQKEVLSEAVGKKTPFCASPRKL